MTARPATPRRRCQTCHRVRRGNRSKCRTCTRREEATRR